MNSIQILNPKLCSAWFSDNQTAKRLLILALLILGMMAPVIAQTTVSTQSKPSWWFGIAGGGNFNFYRGSTHELNATMAPPLAFHDGFGVGLFLAPTIEYYRPYSLLGFMLQIGIDNRRGKFDQIITTCNCPADLSANLSYLIVEPSVRFTPFRNNFYLFGGPRFAFNYKKSFVYQLGINPDYPDQEPTPEVTGDFDNINAFLVSMQVGAGIDIPISSQAKRTQFVISPFVSFHPYFGQNPRSTETWNVTTLRAGAALKFGVAKKPATINEDGVVHSTKVEFNVYSPENIPSERTVKETFPLRNYVFFDSGSTDIPKRYVKLKKNQVDDFSEDQVELFTPENMTGRSQRQLVVYYNVINIVGDRMVKNPNSTIKLVGTSEVNAEDGRQMAQSVKTYLVDVFEIEPSRISVEGRVKPKVAPRQDGKPEDAQLLNEGERKVSIESTSPELLMEFQSGPKAMLKPVEVNAVQVAPIESYVVFENKNANHHFSKWMLEIKDDKGNVQTYGPYTQDIVRIPGKDILGDNKEGNYKVKMIGTTRNGKTIEKETKVRMVLWVPNNTDVAMRFSVIYEFDESEAIAIYEKYLTEVVAKKIPVNGRVFIHGYTDIIGDVEYNEKLSLRRAQDVKKILEKALAKQGRTDVTFEVIGFGENQSLAPFDNKYPEERYYNRTVLIDILPAL